MLRPTIEVCGRQISAVVLALALGTGLLAGCGSQPEISPEGAASPISSTEPTPTDSASTPGAPPSETASPDATPPSQDEAPTDDPSERPPVLDENATGRDLTMSDFFAAADSWQDGRFDVAGKRGLAGVSGPLYDCQDDQDEHETLELRLANRFRKVTMRVGQSDESEQSDAVLNVKLVGNGKYIDSVKVPFNKIDDFSAPVADVNALKIEVWIGGDNCRDQTVGAVLSGLRLE